MAREINLVPDVKNEMIRALKLRNYTFFACIIASIAGVVIIAIFASISIGQQSIVDGKKSTINSLSSEINSYGDIGEYLTIKDQLGNISAISNNKKLLSRSFSLLSALLPTNGDTIIISELEIDLSNAEPKVSFDAYANAKESSENDYENDYEIDYKVLEAFEKSMEYMRYDYGDYVDKNGETIPAYCMIDSNYDGATLVDSEKGYYAYWLINGDGCNPSAEADETTSILGDYKLEQFDGQTVVRIWRTPQFNEWYRESYMDLDGKITGIPHFESKCTFYSGVKENDSATPKWSHTNESCKLVPNGTAGYNGRSSSNGRNALDELVLRFSGTITLNPEVFSFKNHHLIAVAPSGRYNVTDSYVQIQNMFGERAKDCADGDTTCLKNKGDK